MSRTRQFSLASAFTLLAITTGCAADRVAPEPELDPRVLYGFEDCDDLLGYAKGNAKDLIEQYGNPYGGYWFDGGVGLEDGGLDPTGEPAGDSGGDSGGEGDSGGNGGDVEYSGTNVQEVGVDEPDLIKTDGERIVALAQGKLHFVDASGASPQLRGSLELGDYGYDAQMLLHEDRVLLLLRAYVYDYGAYGETDVAPSDEPIEPSPEPQAPQGLDLSKYFHKNTGSVARLVEVDVSDPDNLRIVRNLYVGGDLLSARMVEGVARVVLRSMPTGLEFKDPYEFFNWDAVEPPVEEYPEPLPTSEGEPGTTVGTSATGTTSGSPGTGEGEAAQGGAPKFREGEMEDPYEVEWKKALEAAKLYNLAIVENSKTEDWLPKYVLEDLSQGEPVITQGVLLDCADVKHPGSYSGLSTLSVLTVDLAQALALGQGAGVFADGETVYASKSNLYVTTTPWRPELWDGLEGVEEGSGEGFTSYVHKFSLASSETAEYVASGEVRGRVRSQWSLSEHEGDLRLATTDQLGWDTATSENFVSVLRQEGDELTQIGQVGGLGKGEEIYGVRFIGKVGYVVTYRQIDPLYTIDLSDPAKPLAVGELKIPGYSAYLHPIAEDLILGVGMDGTEEGQTLGVQLSLFDVSDLKNPQRIHQAALGDMWGYSEALFDPKAFLYWKKTGLAVLPVEWYSWDEQTQTDDNFIGALGYHIDAEAGITPVGAVEHTVGQGDEWSWAPSIRRSLVIEDRVLTLSDVGLKASFIGDLSDKSWVEF